MKKKVFNVSVAIAIVALVLLNVSVVFNGDSPFYLKLSATSMALADGEGGSGSYYLPNVTITDETHNPVVGGFTVSCSYKNYKVNFCTCTTTNTGWTSCPSDFTKDHSYTHN